MAWTTPTFSRGEVNRAGEVLRATDPDLLFYPADWDRAITVVNNWRSCHAYPLQVVKMTLRIRARTIARRSRSKALVTQRLKRIDSIWAKLRANQNMSLTQMQDIGGCRAVMRSMRQVNDLIASYERSIKDNPNSGPEFRERYDYIESPKETGYRSMHYVFKYRGGSSQRACLQGAAH